MKYNPVELIIKKRDGKRLNRDEMKFFIESYLNGKIPEYQMASLLMAIFFQGMQPEEVQTLTEVYINSGKRITFPKSLKTVDKHSTGGVGDKISIPLAPIVAACGGKIPMISGRGLGHTGGTLDKLESVPGFHTDFSDREFINFVEEIGFSIIGQSEEIVPADRHIYALRDVTGTVESLPLITASIMSKKIAEGAQNLVIDLKVGTGAFIKNMKQANELAFLLTKTGEKLGQTVSVVFTDMNSPLGKYAGNALEIKESIEFLRGEKISDIYEITKTLAVEMLLLSDLAANSEQAGKMVDEVIENGAALEKFKEFIQAQGGNPRVCDDTTLLPLANYEVPVLSDKTGWIEFIDSREIGYSLVEIGAGRKTLVSKLNYGSGAFLPKKIGDYVQNEQQLGTVFCDNKQQGKIVAERIKNAYRISEKKIEKGNIILKIQSAFS